MVSEKMCGGRDCYARPGRLDDSGLCPKCAASSSLPGKTEMPPNDGKAVHAYLPHPTQPVYLDNGVPRFKPNKIVCVLLDTGKLDMNDLGVMEFSREDREQFAQLIGYSVTGFGELSYASDEVYEKSREIGDEMLARADDARSGRGE